MAGVTMFCLCGSMEYMFCSGYCTSKYGHTCHGPTQQLRFPLQPDWKTPPPLTRLNYDMFVCMEGFVGGAEAWYQSMSSLTQLAFTSATHLTV
jgi:hypothetical protein